jgi:hypothetical protein
VLMMVMVCSPILSWAVSVGRARPTEHITGKGLPSSVTTPLHAIPEGITEAAQGAGRAAAMFEEEFEEARDIAARDMKITDRAVDKLVGSLR